MNHDTGESVPARASLLADAAAEHVAEVSHSLTRALAPRQPMTVAERRENLMALAQIIVAEDDWGLSKVITPALRPLVRYYAAAPDPLPAFGRLLVAVRECSAEETDKALTRLTDDAA